MKKTFVFLAVIFFIAIFSGCGNRGKIEYTPERDTVEIYGDGRYQIMRVMSNQLSLFDLKEDYDIEESIKEYRSEDEKLYVFGSIAYSILNWKTGQLKQYLISSKYPNWNNFMKKRLGNKYIIVKKYSDFTEEEKRIFADMKRK